MNATGATSGTILTDAWRGALAATSFNALPILHHNPGACATILLRTVIVMKDIQKDRADVMRIGRRMMHVGAGTTSVGFHFTSSFLSRV